jgi:hypothetical protein
MMKYFFAVIFLAFLLSAELVAQDSLFVNIESYSSDTKSVSFDTYVYLDSAGFYLAGATILQILNSEIERKTGITDRIVLRIDEENSVISLNVYYVLSSYIPPPSCIRLFPTLEMGIADKFTKYYLELSCEDTIRMFYSLWLNCK